MCHFVIISGEVCTPYALPLDPPLVGVLFSVISVFFGDCTCLQHQDTTDSSLHCPNQLHIFPIHNIDTSLLWTILLVLRIPNIMQSLPL